MQFRTALCGVLALSIASTTSTTIRLEPAVGLALRKSFVSQLEFALESSRLRLGGVEITEGEELAQRSAETTRLVVVDRYLDRDSERIKALIRTYEEFEFQTASELTVAGEAHGTEDEYSSPVVGGNVTFVWNHEEGQYRSFSEDEYVKPEWFAALPFDLDLLAVLPERDVELGDEWNVDPARMWALLRVERGLPLDVAESSEGEPQRDGEVSGELIARYYGNRKHAEIELAAIKLSGVIELAKEDERTVDNADGVRKELHTQTTTIRLDGVISWNLTHGHLYSCELEAEVGAIDIVETSFAFQGQMLDMSTESISSGTLSFKALFEHVK